MLRRRFRGQSAWMRVSSPRMTMERMSLHDRSFALAFTRTRILFERVEAAAGRKTRCGGRDALRSS